MTDFSMGDDFKLMKPEEYRPIMKDAFIRLPPLDEQPHDLMKMLFSKEELEWLDSQRTSR